MHHEAQQRLRNDGEYFLSIDDDDDFFAHLAVNNLVDMLVCELM